MLVEKIYHCISFRSEGSLRSYPKTRFFFFFSPLNVEDDSYAVWYSRVIIHDDLSNSSFQILNCITWCDWTEPSVRIIWTYFVRFSVSSHLKFGMVSGSWIMTLKFYIWTWWMYATDSICVCEQIFIIISFSFVIWNTFQNKCFPSRQNWIFIFYIIRQISIINILFSHILNLNVINFVFSSSVVSVDIVL